MAERTLLSVEEISKHSKPDDCWIVVEGKVWDMTAFAPEHPGGADSKIRDQLPKPIADTGAVILKHAGRDATTSYTSIHAPSVLPTNLPPSAFKGTVDKSTITEDFARPPPTKTPELALNEKPSLSTILNCDDFEEVASRTLSKKTWAFYSSAATDCVTRTNNRKYFERIWWRPRIFRNVREVSTKSKMLGHEVGMPMFVSPAAMARLVHPEGEKDLARGCVSGRVPQCISTNASYPVEEIVPVAPKDHPFFFQLYVNRDRPKTEALLQHVRSLGISTVFVTVDAPVPGKREADERVRADESLSTPMSGASEERQEGRRSRADYGKLYRRELELERPAVAEEGLGRENSGEGCAGRSGREEVCGRGVEGVVLSNHGGRSIDTAPPAVMLLLECQRCCPEIFDKLEVYVDGGIRRGTDILKCLCLGATAVGLGRPFLYALNYGQEGVEHLVDTLKDELEVSMKMVGITDLSQVHPGLVNTLDVDHLVPSSLEGHPYAKWRPRARL
ncbi:hypothetical protein H2203_005928 [Taxawa tesnikishii (nom. ined.)]|nr:hypothetical protein H2203_005928 [Dothideales sp. JES 119]